MKSFKFFTKTASFLAFACSFLIILPLGAQISIDQSFTPSELVNNILVGSGVQVSNVTFNMQPGDSINNQIGKINGPSQFFEFDEAIAMATGDVMVFEGGLAGSVDLNISGDADLSQLMLVSASANNCAILEFDFVPNFEFLTVQYVFGSLEYPAFTCSGFNDVFGFFVSGPGISGPYSNNSVNIALIPDTDVAVGINSVNSGDPGFQSPQYCLMANPNFVQDSIYFVENDPPLAGDIQFPGMTVPLSANIILQPGETYHIKLAIADAMDTAFDSGVVLEGSSFSAFPLTSLPDISESVSFSLFPNPASHILNFHIGLNENSMVDVRILNSVGQVVMTPVNNLLVAGSYFHQMDISALSSGLYVAELTDRATGQVVTRKFRK
jgi:hypothetical protein